MDPNKDITWEDGTDLSWDDTSSVEPPLPLDPKGRSFGQTLWDNAMGAVGTSAEVMGRGLSQGVESVKAPFVAAEKLGEKIGEEIYDDSKFPQPDPKDPLSTPKRAMQALYSGGLITLEEMNKALDDPAFMTKLGTTLFGAAAGGRSPLNIAVGATIGGMAGQEAVEEMGLEADTPFFSKEKLKQSGANFVEGYFFPKILQGAGKVISGTGSALKSATVPFKERIKHTQQKPGYFSRQFTVGKNTKGESSLIKDLKRGEPTMKKVLLDEFPEEIPDADTFSRHLKTSIKERVAVKKRELGFAERALEEADKKGANLGRLSKAEVGYRDLTSEIRKLKRSASNEGVVSELSSLKKRLDETFSTPHSEKLFAGMGKRVKTRKGISDAQNLLDALYEDMRDLRAFDDDALANRNLNPSTRNQALKQYEQITAKIREQIPLKMESLERAGFLKKGTADTIRTVNKEIHDLIPFEDAVDRVALADFQTMGEGAPGSMLKMPGSSFTGGGDSWLKQAGNAIARPFSKHLVDRDLAVQRNEWFPGQVSNMRESAQVSLGRTAPPRLAPEGILGQGVGPTMEVVGDALNNPAVAPGMAVLANAPVISPLITQLNQSPQGHSVLAYDEIVKDPLSLEALQADEDFTPDTINAIEQSVNASRWEKAQALGKLKYEARDKGWFPPPLMEGIHSFVELPNTQYEGDQVVGTIVDPGEREIYLDAIMGVSDPEKRAKLKSAINSNGKYVLEIPSTLRRDEPRVKDETPKPSTSAVLSTNDSPASSVVSDNSGDGLASMDRIQYAY